MKHVGRGRLRRFCHRALSTSIALFLLAGASIAEIKPGQLYLVLSTSRTKTLQKEIDEATAEGFRMVATTSRGGGQVVLLRRSAPKGEEFGYRVLGTTKVDTMEKELNEAAAAGYCLIPGTMVSRDRAFGPPELVAFMERPPGSERQCEYRLVATSRTGSMGEELVEVEEQGFKLIDVAQASELTGVLEREQ